MIRLSKHSSDDMESEMKWLHEAGAATVSEILANQHVTAADIAWWNGLTLYEREATERSQYAANIACLKTFAGPQGLRPEEAMRKLYKVFAQFSDYPIEEGAIREWRAFGYSEEDDWLPWQLHKRCSEFTMHCLNGDQKEWFKQTAAKFETMNAFLRAQIKDGRI